MVKVLIAENSHIISLGLVSLVKALQDIEAVKIVNNEDECCSIVANFDPDIILINTSFLKAETMVKLMGLKKADALVIHVFNTSLPIESPTQQLSILDSKEVLKEKLEEIFNKVRQTNKEFETEELSPREKAILKEVALGLTNKEIAEKTYISTHTVISHRKNITRKLGIKTVSGLTVYAILNNIIHMDDIS